MPIAKQREQLAAVVALKLPLLPQSNHLLVADKSMPIELHRAVWLLGASQCVLWGVLYYSFSVFLAPMAHDLGLSQTAVAGAFSLGLFVMASSAPSVGRLLDRGYAPQLVRGGMALAVAGLVLLSLARSGVALYIGWLLLGMAMAALLYESAFVLVLRAVGDPLHRLRALAAITVMGGLASTIFLPGLSWTIEQWGWQTTILSCALAVLAVAWLMEYSVLPCLNRTTTVAHVGRGHGQSRRPAYFATLMLMFVLATSASMTVTTLLIPLLLRRGTSLAVAALVLAALGIAQLPGRVWLLRSGRPFQGRLLTVTPVMLQAMGLLTIAATTPLWLVTLGVAVFGLGAGLQTLSRPWLVQALYGVDESGRWNGELARAQGYARAIGPVTAVAIASWVNPPVVMASMGALLAVTILLVRRLPT